MAYVGLKSLRTRFLTLLVLGGSFVASAGLWITYTTTVGHFEAQLVARGKLLAESLNHSATVADTPMQVQHVVDEFSLSPHFQNIIIASGEPPEVLASSNRAWNGTRLDQLPDRHLSEHLLEVIAQGDFGHHFDDERESLVLTAPLEPHITYHQGHDTSMMPSSAAPEQATTEHGTTHEHGPMHMHGSSHDVEPRTARYPLPYRGAIMLFLDNKGATTALSQTLWLLCTVLLAAILITISIAHVLVDRQILARLNVFRHEIDRIVGLELGADDYVAKSYSPRELFARIKSVFRPMEHAQLATQGEAAPAEAARFAGWNFDLTKRELSSPDGKAIDLTSSEFDLLSVFVRHPQRVLSRVQLLDYGRGYTRSPFDRSVDVQVMRLRRKIALDPQNPALIKTVRNVGYIFTPNVAWS